MQLQRMREFFDVPVASVSVEAGAEAGNARSITLQVRDRLRAAWPGRWVLRVWVSASSGGDPDATGNTVAFTAGTVMATLTANAAYDVLSDADGKAVFTLTIAGAATRYVSAVVMPGLVQSAALTWA